MKRREDCVIMKQGRKSCWGLPTGRCRFTILIDHDPKVATMPHDPRKRLFLEMPIEGSLAFNLRWSYRSAVPGENSVRF